MVRTHHGQHGDDCFGCKAVTVQVSPAATPTRTKYLKPPRTPNNSYEKGIPTDERGMPYLLPNSFEPAGQKFVDQHRHQIEDTRRRNRQKVASPA